MATKHVLLLHAGGDSKRVPWANPMGKAFLPVPYLAGDNPDGPVPLLFDHILAVSASARQAFKNQGCGANLEQNIIGFTFLSIVV
jgi:fucokinase